MLICEDLNSWMQRMKSKTKTNSPLDRLRRLDQQSQRLRKSLGLSKPGEIIFRAPQNMWSENDVVVEADGIGGGKLLIVEGNYPIDYSIKSEEVFPSEDAACEAAERMLEK